MSKELAKLVNASGFAFQMAVEHAVRSAGGHNFEVVAREHAWRDPQREQEGYVDLVLQSSAVMWAVECKRARDATWVFLVDQAKRDPVAEIRCLWIKTVERGKRVAGWVDVKTQPLSPEAQFCAVRGQGEGQTPTLERVSAPLIRSTDALANEDLGVSETQGVSAWGIYIPVVVTTATLQVAYVDPSRISIADGTVPDDTQFEEVPMMRFRKTFSTDPPPNPKGRYLQRVSVEKERTVLVINVLAFVDILRAVRMFRNAPFENWPWIEGGLEPAG